MSFLFLPLFQHAAPFNPTALGYRPKMKTFGPPLKMLSHDHPALLFHSEMLLPWKLKLVCRLCGNTGSFSRRWMCVVCSTPRLQGRSDGSLFFAHQQPLGSLPHVCPDGAGRLSAGSQLHLGDSAAGLPADAVPREPVRPVQPQLVAQDKFSPRSPRSATGCRADPDVAKLVFCIMRRPPSPQPAHPSTNSHQLSGLVSLTET